MIAALVLLLKNATVRAPGVPKAKAFGFPPNNPPPFESSMPIWASFTAASSWKVIKVALSTLLPHIMVDPPLTSFLNIDPTLLTVIFSPNVFNPLIVCANSVNTKLLLAPASGNVTVRFANGCGEVIVVIKGVPNTN